MAGLSKPLASSAWSRTISAVSRWCGPCASSRLRGIGGAQRGRGARALAIGGAGDHFAQQRLHVPVQIVLRNAAPASPAIRDGWAVRRRCRNPPASPRCRCRNSCSQKRFTATRAVRGWSGPKNHFARVRRLRGALAGSLGKSAGVSAARSGPIGVRKLPRSNSRVGRRSWNSLFGHDRQRHAGDRLQLPLQAVQPGDLVLKRRIAWPGRSIRHRRSAAKRRRGGGEDSALIGSVWVSCSFSRVARLQALRRHRARSPPRRCGTGWDWP